MHPIQTSSDRKHLILIAGPAASGKTCLINGMLEGRFPALRDQLGMSHPAAWQKSSLRNINDSLADRADKWVVHCDLYNTGAFDRIEVLLLSQNHVTTLTLCTSADTLRIRNRQRIAREMRAFLKHPRQQAGRPGKLYGLCKRQIRNRNRRGLSKLYQNWFRLLSQHGDRNFYLENDAVNDHPVALAATPGLAPPCNLI